MSSESKLESLPDEMLVQVWREVFDAWMKVGDWGEYECFSPIEKEIARRRILNPEAWNDWPVRDAL